VPGVTEQPVASFSHVREFFTAKFSAVRNWFKDPFSAEFQSSERGSELVGTFSSRFLSLSTVSTRAVAIVMMSLIV